MIEKEIMKMYLAKCKLVEEANWEGNLYSKRPRKLPSCDTLITLEVDLDTAEVYEKNFIKSKKRISKTNLGRSKTKVKKTVPKGKNTP